MALQLAPKLATFWPISTAAAYVDIDKDGSEYYWHVGQKVDVARAAHKRLSNASTKWWL